MKWVYILQVASIILSGTGIYLYIFECLNVPPVLIASGAMMFGISEKIHKKLVKKEYKHGREIKKADERRGFYDKRY